jgi:hypothetical protein
MRAVVKPTTVKLKLQKSTVTGRSTSGGTRWRNAAP